MSFSYSFAFLDWGGDKRQGENKKYTQKLWNCALCAKSTSEDYTP